MIAVHLEPKGLEPDAIPLADHVAVANDRYDAVAGSQRLLQAILKAQGKPAKVIRLPVPVFRKRHRTRGRPKGDRKVRAYSLKIVRIMALVAEHFGIATDDLLMIDRRWRFSRPRQIAMYLARKTTTASFPDIGHQFNGRDHTTVMHGFREVEKRIAANESETILALQFVRDRIGA